MKLKFLSVAYLLSLNTQLIFASDVKFHLDKAELVIEKVVDDTEHTIDLKGDAKDLTFNNDAVNLTITASTDRLPTLSLVSLVAKNITISKDVVLHVDGDILIKTIESIKILGEISATGKIEIESKEMISYKS